MHTFYTVPPPLVLPAATMEAPKPVSPKFEYPKEQAIFALRFLAPVERLRKYRGKLRQEVHIAPAREWLAEPHHWREWCAWTLRDACKTDFKMRTGHEAYPEEPEAFDVDVKLDPQMPKSIFNPDSWSEVEGVVTFRGPIAGFQAFELAAQWRIGDRMCFHGARDEAADWIAYTRPAGFTITPVPQGVENQ